MAKLQSDSQGFLLGERLLDSSQELLRAQSRAEPMWRDIRNDVRSIARQLGVQVGAPSGRGGAAARSAPLPASVPVGRGGARAAGVPAASAAALVQRGRAGTRPASIPQRDARGRFIATPVTLAVDESLRDGRGRFKKSDAGAPDEKPGKKPDDPSPRNLAALADRLDRLGAGLSGSTENIDPALNAAKEVRDAVAPLGRGLGGLFGQNAERKKERWYQRIWKALTKKGDDDKKAAAKAGSSGGGLLSGAGALIGGAGGMLKRGGASALRVGGGLLRRIPVLGALFSGGMSLAGALGLNDDPSKSPEENRAMRYRSSGEAAGMGIGGLLGGAVGSLLGPLGTAAGAYLGGMLGEKIGGAVGDWSRSMIDAKVPEKIVAYVGAAWDSIVGEVRVWIGGAKAALQAAGDSIASAAGIVNKWVKEKTGVDIAATAKGAWETAKSTVVTAAGAAVDFVKANAPSLVPETVKRAAAAGERAVTGMLGISKVVETGAGYNVVQRGDGSTVRQDGARNWRNNNPGNIEYGDFAKRFGAIGSDGRFAIFPDYETGRAAKAALIFDGKAYRDLSLSAAISRYAPPSENNTAAYHSAVLAAAGGEKRMGDYTPAERRAILDAMQRVEGYKVGTVKQVGARMGAGVSVPALPATVAAGVATLGATDLPRAVEVKPSPTQLNSDAQPVAPMKVKVETPLGQDVGDRALAHIVSGGIGGS